jgi:drug/metabolite transporter (DMT)-like permease
VAGTVLLWGSAFVGIRAALRDLSPYHLALLRFMAASVFMAPFALGGRVRRPAVRDLPILLLTGFVGIGFYNIVLNYGAQTISAGSSSFIISTAPIVTALIAFAFLGERINIVGWAGMLLSFGGVSLIAFGEGGSLHFEIGAVFVFMASVSTSVYFVIQKPLLRRYSSFEVACYSIWFGTLTLLPFAGGIVSAVSSAPLHTSFVVIYLGVFPAALAYFFWSYVLSRLTASRSVSFLYLVPVAATLLAFLILGETLSLLTLAGGACSLTGVILLNTIGKVRGP